VLGPPPAHAPLSRGLNWQGINENTVAMDAHSCEPQSKRAAPEPASAAQRGVLLRWVCRAALGAARQGDRRLILKSFELVPLPDGAAHLDGSCLADAPTMAAAILARSPGLRPGALVTALVPLRPAAE